MHTCEGCLSAGSQFVCSIFEGNGGGCRFIGRDTKGVQPAMMLVCACVLACTCARVFAMVAVGLGVMSLLRLLVALSKAALIVTVVADLQVESWPA